MTQDEQKVQLADQEHSLEVKKAEIQALQAALQASDAMKAIQAKNKEIADLIKAIRDLKVAIYG